MRGKETLRIETQAANEALEIALQRVNQAFAAARPGVVNAPKPRELAQMVVAFKDYFAANEEF